MTDMNRRALIGAVAALAISWPARARTPFRSNRISVSVTGRGPDVILIPGLASAPWVWADAVKALPGRRYHLVQLAGFAGAPAGANATGPVAAPVAEELARYIAETGLKRPAVVGHSMGGTIGLMLAARHPAAIGRLMVVDMVPFVGMLYGPPGTIAASVRPVADGVKAGLLAASPQARAANVEKTIAGMIRTPAARPRAIRDALASDRDVGARAMHELIVTDLRPELPRIAVPVTVLWVRGPNIPLTEDQFGAAYRASFAGVRQLTLTHVPESRHFIMQDQPARFHRALQAFLTP